MNINFIKWTSVVICILIGVSITIFTLGKTFLAFSPFLTTYSPKGVYAVSLSGQKERPAFFTNKVYFNVVRNGKPFISNQLLHSGDSFDSSFETAYPNHKWLDENILVFYREKNLTSVDNDTVIIKNNTKNEVKYIKLYSPEDKFLLFDIHSRAKVKLSISSSRGDYPGVYAKGEFSNGECFEYGSGFVINKETNGPFTYYLTINNENITIENPQLKKYNNEVLP